MNCRLESREAVWNSRSPFKYPTNVLGTRISRYCISDANSGVPYWFDLRGRVRVISHVVIGTANAKRRGKAKPSSTVREENGIDSGHKSFEHCQSILLDQCL